MLVPFHTARDSFRDQNVYGSPFHNPIFKSHKSSFFILILKLFSVFLKLQCSYTAFSNMFRIMTARLKKIPTQVVYCLQIFC